MDYLYLLFRLVSQIRASQFRFVGQTALVGVKDLFRYNNSPLSAVRLLLFVFDVFFYLRVLLLSIIQPSGVFGGVNNNNASPKGRTPNVSLLCASPLGCSL